MYAGLSKAPYVSVMVNDYVISSNWNTIYLSI